MNIPEISSAHEFNDQYERLLKASKDRSFEMSELLMLLEPTVFVYASAQSALALDKPPTNIGKEARALAQNIVSKTTLIDISNAIAGADAQTDLLSPYKVLPLGNDIWGIRVRRLADARRYILKLYIECIERIPQYKDLAKDFIAKANTLLVSSTATLVTN
jgi:hypothetical protein